MSSSVAERAAGRKSPVTRTNINRALILIFVVALLFVPLMVNAGLLYLVGTTLVLGVYCVGWNVLFSWAGLASFGSGGLFALGAYVSAVTLRAGWGEYFLLILVAAALVGGVVAALIGLIALRRTTGIFLAILTLSLAELLRHTLMQMRWLGSEDGISGIVRPIVNLGFVRVDLTSGPAYYWFICALAALVIALCWWVAHGPNGRRMLASRHDVQRAAFVGIDTYRTRLLAFVISGAVAGFAGGLYAPWAQIVTPELSGMFRSTQPILFTLLGGLHSFWGPLIGAFVFMVVEYATRTLIGIQEIITGGILLAVVLVFRSGIAGGWNALIDWLFPDRESR